MSIVILVREIPTTVVGGTPLLSHAAYLIVKLSV